MSIRRERRFNVSAVSYCFLPQRRGVVSGMPGAFTACSYLSLFEFPIQKVTSSRDSGIKFSSFCMSVRVVRSLT